MSKKNRKEKTKEKLSARRAFYDALNRAERNEFLSSKLRRRLAPGSFRVTFTFSPEETETLCAPTQEQMEVFGLKRALERLDRKDFYTNVSIIAQGQPTKENLSKIRQEVLLGIKQRALSDQTTNLQSFQTTATTETTNETEPSTDSRTES
jgi:hypothetical protein